MTERDTNGSTLQAIAWYWWIYMAVFFATLVIAAFVKPPLPIAP